MSQNVICISSDDDDTFLEQDKKKHDVLQNRPHTSNGKKRKASTEAEDALPQKRIHPTTVTVSSATGKLTKPASTSTVKLSKSKDLRKNSVNQPSTSTASKLNGHVNEKLIDNPGIAGKGEDSKISGAPQLIIKDKRPVENNHDGSEVFSQFLSLCLSKERTPAMQKIVERLKRHYEQMDPHFARSPVFIQLLNEKRDLLMNEDRLFVHIIEIDEEMKCRKRDISSIDVFEDKITNKVEKQDQYDDSYDDSIDPKQINRIKKVSKAMQMCQEKIKQLEEQEVVWDDGEDSNYIKVSKYKERMTQLYYKYCELTGKNENIGQLHIKPKRLRVTKIDCVDQAIVSFVTKKLTQKMKRQKKGLSAADCVIFPDYLDILNCIEKCNNERKMGMNKRETEELAKKAFEDLGNYLQQVRRRELYLTTMSLIDEPLQPEPHDPDLLRTLDNNKVLAKQKMDAIFEQFSRRQENKPHSKESECSENGTHDDGHHHINRDHHNADEEGDNCDDDDDGEDDDDENDNDYDNDGYDHVDSHFDGKDNQIDGKSLNKNIEDVILTNRKNSTTGVEVRNGKTEEENDECEISDTDTVVLSGLPEPQDHEDLCFPADSRTVLNAKDKFEPNDKSTNDTSHRESEGLDPKSIKKSTKPMITNIRPVKVVIKSHDIVKIREENEQQSIEATINEKNVESGSDSQRHVLEDKSHCDQLTKIMTTDEKQSTTQIQLDEGSDIEIVEEISKPGDSMGKESRINDTRVEPLRNCNDISTSGEKSHEEITSSTGNNPMKNPVGKSIPSTSDSRDIIGVGDGIIPLENESPLPDSTLRDTSSPHDMTADDHRALENQMAGSKPVLKLRSFAKPPVFWKSPAEKMGRKQLTGSRIRNESYDNQSGHKLNESTVESQSGLSTELSAASLKSQPTGCLGNVDSSTIIKYIGRSTKKVPTVISPKKRIVIRPVGGTSPRVADFAQPNEQKQDSMKKLSPPIATNGAPMPRTNVFINPLNRVVRKTSDLSTKFVNPMSLPRKE